MNFLRVLCVFLKQADSKLNDAVPLRDLLGAWVSIRGGRVLDKEIRLTKRWWQLNSRHLFINGDERGLSDSLYEIIALLKQPRQ
jgi:hypothetical protein